MKTTERTTSSRRGMGWLPDYPDLRDYDETRREIRSIIDPESAGSVAGPRRSRKEKAGENLRGASSLLVPLGERTRPSDIPTSVDLREHCSPIEDQGALGSCTAHAGTALIEYYERRSFGRHLDASRLFLYKVTRNLMKLKGDTGAYLRSTIGAMVLFGVPPESYWPYNEKETAFDREPPAFCYAFAQNYQTIKYFRHDPPESSPAAILNHLKAYLAKGHPAMFGFTVYNSIEQAEKDGRIPFPFQRERIEGGHAMAAVGYDDKIEIVNRSGAKDAAVKTKGALLIRNSWGTGWGESGYGWLPYDYVLRGLAEDFWSILKKEWVDTGEFGG